MLVPPSPPPLRATQYCAELKLIARHQLIVVVVGEAMEYISSGSLNVARADISLLRKEVEAISCRP